MIGIITFIVFLVAAALYAVSARSSGMQETQDRYGHKSTQVRPRYIITIIGIVVVGVIVSMAQPYAVQKIDVAHVGLKVNLIGDERGMSSYQFRTGWVVYNIYTEEVVEIPSNQQHVEYKPIAVFTKGGFSAQIAPSFNYEIVPAHAGEMYVSLRRPLDEVRDTWLYTAAIGGMNDVVNRWAVDSIFNKREQFDNDVMAEVNKRVGKWFMLSQIRTNITPPPELQAAINAKTNAVQQAQQAAAENERILMENLNKISTARGDSAQRVIEANGIAEAMRVQKQEITPLYVEYLKVTNWDGKNPTTLVTNGSSTSVMVK